MSPLGSILADVATIQSIMYLSIKSAKQVHLIAIKYINKS